MAQFLFCFLFAFSSVLLSTNGCSPNPANCTSRSDSRNCYDAVVINVPTTVSQIAANAFSSMPCSTKFVLPTTITYIGISAFQQNPVSNINIPSGVVSIDDYAFYYCTALTSIDLSRCTKLQSLGIQTFEGSGIISISIPASVLIVASFSFYSSTSLTSVTFLPPSATISAGNTQIGLQAFVGCTSLKSVTFSSPNAVVDDYAFSNLPNLVSIICSNPPPTFSKLAFQSSSVSGCTSYISTTLSPTTAPSNSPSSIAPMLLPSGTPTVAPVAPSRTKPSTRPSSIKPMMIHPTTAPTQTPIQSSPPTTLPPLLICATKAQPGCNRAIRVSVPSTIASVVKYAFSNVTSLVSVFIPSTITLFAPQSFSSCTSLTTINVPTSVITIGNYAFFGCTSLSSIDLSGSSGLKRIGTNAFQGTSLINIYIPGSVSLVNNLAFFSIPSLTSVTVGSSSSTTTGCVIGIQAFLQCPSLTTVVLSTSVQYIGNYAFYGATKLTTVICGNPPPSLGIGVWLDSGVNGCTGSITAVPTKEITIIQKVPTISATVIPTIAPSFKSTLASGVVCTFRNDPGCFTATNIIVPSTVTSIGSYSFYALSALLAIQLPTTISLIGMASFAQSASLSLINIPSSVTMIDDYAFYFCESLSTLDLSSSTSLQRIGMYAFQGTSLTQVVIPSSVTSADNFCFYAVSTITSMIFAAPTPGSLVSTAIGTQVCAFCSSLNTVALSSSVVLVDDYAFYGATKLSSLTCANPSTLFGLQALYDTEVTGCTVLVSSLNPSIASTFAPTFSSTASPTLLPSSSQPSKPSKKPSAAPHLPSLKPSAVPTTKAPSDSPHAPSTKVSSIPTFKATQSQRPSPATPTSLTSNIPTSSPTYYVPSISPSPPQIFCSTLYDPGCHTATSISISTTISSIARNAFDSCSLLVSVFIPTTITLIGSQAFKQCTSLKFVNIPTSVVNIDDYAFYFCTSLPFLDLSLSTGLQRVGQFAYQGAGLGGIVLPGSITLVDSYAFYQAQQLASVEFSAPLPGATAQIGVQAFFGCKSLSSVVISSGVTYISDYAFYNLHSLTSFVCGGPPPSLGVGVFFNSGVSGCSSSFTAPPATAPPTMLPTLPAPTLPITSLPTITPTSSAPSLSTTSVPSRLPNVNVPTVAPTATIPSNPVDPNCCASTSYSGSWPNCNSGAGISYFTGCSECVAYACIDWSAGSIANQAREAAFFQRTGQQVYFGVGSYGNQPTRAGNCYRITVGGVDRDFITQVVNSGGDVPDVNFDLQMGDGGFGIFNGCTNDYTPLPQFDGTSAQWGDQYGGWGDSAAECANLPPYPHCGSSPQDNLQDLCVWSFQQNLRGTPIILNICQVSCPVELYQATGIRRSDEPTSAYTCPYTANGNGGILTRMMDCSKPAYGWSSNVKGQTFPGQGQVVPCRRDGYTRINS